MTRRKPLVLVVDDVKRNRDVLEGMVLELGYDAHHAADGIEALDAVTTHGPDLVLLDIDMPRMDGSHRVRASQVRPRPAADSHPGTQWEAGYAARFLELVDDGIVERVACAQAALPLLGVAASEPAPTTGPVSFSPTMTRQQLPANAMGFQPAANAN